MGKTPSHDKGGLKKGPWTPEEDEKLISYIRKHGQGRWKTVPKIAGLERCGKSCRLRWTNYLRPDIKRGRFTFEEEEAIIQLHSILGNKWSAIAARLPGRTDNEIKNYWNTHIRKRLLRMGIDPVTHSPRLDLLQLYSVLSSFLVNSPQPNIQNLSGIPQSSLESPLMNPNLLNVVASLFSKPVQFLPQNVNSQNHYQKTSSSWALEEYSELMQTNKLAGQESTQSSFTLPYLYQQLSESDTNMIDGPNQSLIGLLSGKQTLESTNNNIKSPDFGFGSLSMSKSTPVQSPTTFVSATTEEEERDIYCSMLEVPKNIDIQSLM